jgi:hypothetical protein
MGLPEPCEAVNWQSLRETFQNTFSAILIRVWDFVLSPQFWAGVAVSAGTLLLAFFVKRRGRLDSLTLSIPFGLGSITYKTTPAERILAWKLYVQLTTRKAALPFDDGHDLIVEVYESLFDLFSTTRDLILELPSDQFQVRDGLASLMLRVQKDGVRPHLTRWQADFRWWWERATNSRRNRGRSPQEIQRQYPRYSELVSDLQRTNVELSKFADELLDIARGPQKGRRRRQPRVEPRPPREADHT